MTRLSRLVTPLAAPLLLLGALACSNASAELGGPATVGVGQGPVTITVLNDGAVALNNVRVQTSEIDSLPLISVLNPGQKSAAYKVRTAHEFALVRAVVRGRAAIAHPVEGFSGFNPAVPAGAYTLKLRFGEDGEILDLRMVPNGS